MSKLTKAAAALSNATGLTIKGVSYDLVVTNGALIRFEKLTGISTITDADRITENPSRETLAAMLFVLLKDAGATFTLPEVQGMMTRNTTSTVYTAIVAAWAEHIARENAEDDPIQPTPAR